jgi:hypothetical protein
MRCQRWPRCLAACEVQSFFLLLWCAWRQASSQHLLYRRRFLLEATDVLPDESQITSGRYQPANYEGVETFPDPVPTPSGGSELSVFDGTNPNGVWQLYILDDTNVDKGRLGCWSLDITM